MGMVLMGVIWVWLTMMWAWTGGVANVLELVFKKLEPMQIVLNLLSKKKARGRTEAKWLIQLFI